MVGKENFLLTNSSLACLQIAILAGRHGEYRAVKIGESVAGERVIKSGLSDGDLVITEGIIKIRPGMPVAPKNQDTPEAADKQEAPTE